MRPLLFALLLALASTPLPAAATSPWPQGKDCAVSLTYDDGLESQILNAAFDLDQRGLKGTFFPTGSSAYVSANAAAWTALAAKGHELGSHTMVHPCAGSTGKGWLAPADFLEAYTQQRMARELDQSVLFLRGLGAKGALTLAYPCGQSFVGEARESYVPLVQARFRAARGVNNQIADPLTVDLYKTPGWDASGRNAAGLKALVETARQKGGWLILMFHGVGGDHLSLEADAHAALLDALQADPKVWTVPFGKAAAWVGQIQAQAR